MYIWWIVISQNKDPYEPISIMECHKGFVSAAQMTIDNSHFQEEIYIFSHGGIPIVMLVFFRGEV